MINKILYPLCLIIISITACERQYLNDITSETLPELHVIVKDTNNLKVSNATVRLFTSETDFNDNSGHIADSQTNFEGVAIFTKSQLRDPGIFYIYVSKDNRNNINSNTVTPYILLNDGHTLFYTKIE